jgi:SAM-dependent methyltransferase
MTAEFTGERVVPGQVDVDLWNEHVARYAFASGLSRNRRVLDAGCGAGYGTAELALNAQHVTGIDVSPDALAYAAANFARTNIRWVQASAATLPFRAGTFDLVVAFEVIEHLRDWQSLLDETKRVLAPGGQCIVSTPNKQFYADTRGDSGPNPFHEHEFEYEEFCAALSQVFPTISMFVQDHAEGVLFRAVSARSGADVRLEAADYNPRHSHFFVAVCGMGSQPPAPTFVYIPRAANLLKERLAHIERLRSELDTKDGWLASAQNEHQQLLKLFQELTAELEKNNRWARDLESDLSAARERIGQIQSELDSQHTAVQQVSEVYEERLTEANEELGRRTTWAHDIEAQLKGKTEELANTVELLDRAESTVQERTNWALALQRERDAFEAELAKVKSSRWVRLGQTIGVGPEIQKA